MHPLDGCVVTYPVGRMSVCHLHKISYVKQFPIFYENDCTQIITIFGFPAKMEFVFGILKFKKFQF